MLILHSFISDHITIDNYYYLLSLCKTKKILMHQQYKLENNELKEVCIKNWTCCYFYNILKLENFDLDNIFLDEKSHKNILIYDISYKTLIGSKPLWIRFNKIDGIIRIYNELHI